MILQNFPSVWQASCQYLKHKISSCRLFISLISGFQPCMGSRLIFSSKNPEFGSLMGACLLE